MSGIVRAILASGGLVLVWAVLTAVVFGLGQLVRWGLGLAAEDDDDPWLTCWLGIGFGGTILLAWNFLAPIDGSASLLLAVIGLAVCGRAARHLLDALRATRLSLGPIGLALVAAFSLWLANHARGELTHWDSGNYQIQAVRWTAAFPVVPGLANLHSRLGYQSAAVPLYAAIDTGPLRGRAQHVANGLLLLLLGTGAIVKIFRHGEPNGSPMFVSAVQAGGLAVAVAWIAREETVTSFATDVPMMAFGFATAHAFLVLLARTDKGASVSSAQVATVAFLGAFAVAIKLVLAALAGAMIAIAMWLFWTQRASAVFRLRGLTLAGAIVLVPIGLTLARAVVTTGYPLYPSSVLPFHVDWRVPAEQPLAERKFIRATARLVESDIGINPGADALRNWFPRWIQRQLRIPFNFLVPFAIAIVGLSVISLSTDIRRRLPPLLALGPFAFGIVAWWQVAPMSRWAVVPCWVLAAYVMTGPLRVLSATSARRILWAPAILALLGATAANVAGSDSSTRLRAFAHGVAGNPFGDWWLNETVPQPVVRSYVTDSGVRLNVPTGWDGRCWDTALPCTPTPARNLELRAPAEPGRGFRVRGEWSPENWPEPWLTHFRR